MIRSVKLDYRSLHLDLAQLFRPCQLAVDVGQIEASEDRGRQRGDGPDVVFALGDFGVGGKSLLERHLLNAVVKDSGKRGCQRAPALGGQMHFVMTERREPVE